MERGKDREIRDNIAGLGPGAFHFTEVYGPGWNRLPIGEKVRTGRQFLEAVRKGDYPGVEDTGKKAGGGRLYRKR